MVIEHLTVSICFSHAAGPPTLCDWQAGVQPPSLRQGVWQEESTVSCWRESKESLQVQNETLLHCTVNISCKSSCLTSQSPPLIKRWLQSWTFQTTKSSFSKTFSCLYVSDVLCRDWRPCYCGTCPCWAGCPGTKPKTTCCVMSSAGSAPAPFRFPKVGQCSAAE